MCDINVRRPLGVCKPRSKELSYRTKPDLPLQLPVNHGDQHPSANEDEEFLAHILQVCTTSAARGERDREIETLGNRLGMELAPAWSVGDNINYQYPRHSTVTCCPSLCKLQLAIALLTPRVVGASLCDLFPWVLLFSLLLQVIGEHRMFLRNIVVLRTAVHSM
jgi:hypothetical protein